MCLYKNILTRFPRANVAYVFAYGSGVKQQLGYDNLNTQKNNIIDLIFCVKDPLGWHAENLVRHERHYSALRHLGSNFIMQYQEKWGAKVYFNTLVTLRDLGVRIKYGVISREHMLEDLLEWKYLYISGRLQKPVVDIVSPQSDNQLTDALSNNLKSALQVALLLLPEKFTAFELYHTIANLSYKGDFRMIFGENKRKVQNIVQAQLSEFQLLYKPAMQSLFQYVAMQSNRGVLSYEQDKSPAANEYHLRFAPMELRKRLMRNAAYQEKHMQEQQTEELPSLGHVFGPALPPQLVQQQKTTATATKIPTVTTTQRRNEKSVPTIIGPIMPEEYQKSVDQSLNDHSNSPHKYKDNDDDIYGPLPSCSKSIKNSKYLELEERALQLKMAAMDGTFPTSGILIENVREEWMLELPDVGLKTGLAALDNIKRGFYQGKDNRDFSDRSSWTKVPNTSNTNKPSSSKIQESLRKKAVAQYEKLRDEEQEIAAKKHKKKHKREKSLIDLHQSKLHKERKKKEKELLKLGGIFKSERKPFSRDVDLKLNKIDRQMSKQIVDKAKLLDTKFSNGAIKYL